MPTSPPSSLNYSLDSVPKCAFETADLSALSSDAASELDVLGHDGHSLGVDGAQVGVLKETHEVGLGGLLES